VTTIRDLSDPHHIASVCTRHTVSIVDASRKERERPVLLVF